MKFASKTIIVPSALAFGFSTLVTTTALAEPMDFTVSGYFTQSLQLVDIDDHRNFEDNRITSFEDEVLAQNAEIHFKAKTMLDNGTELGIRVELEASNVNHETDNGSGSANAAQIDEHYLYMKGDWGKLIVGAENGVGHLMQVRAPRFVPGLKVFDNSLTDDVYERAYDSFLGENTIEDAHMSTKLEHISGDANKISYFTPRVGGMQLGVSYTPNNANREGGENNAEQTAPRPDNGATQEDIIELGLSFKGRSGPVGYKLSYTNVESDNTAPSEVREDPKSNSTGLALSYGDWVFGGNISEYENLEALDDRKYDDSKSIETTSYGLKYKMGDAHWGVAFTKGEEDFRPAGRANVEYEETMIGGGRKLTEGAELGYYYTISKAEQGTVDGEVSALGATLALKF